MSDNNIHEQASPENMSDQPNRLPMILAGMAAFVLLAVIGSVGGIVLADSRANEPIAQASPAIPLPAVSSTETSAAPASSPARRTDAPVRDRPTRSADDLLPDLTGQDFLAARNELRNRDLGWHVVFLGEGDSRKVVRTDPAPGTPVAAGRTVKLVVAGAPPVVMVPDVTNQRCATAAARLGDEGFYPRYPEGKTGLVREQDPAAGTQANWNDSVSIYCGSAPSNPPPATTVSPSPTP